MRRDGLEPVQPHYPKIFRPYSRGSMCWVNVLLKIPLLKIFSKANWFLWYSNGPYHHFKMASCKRRAICPYTPSPWLQGWMADCLGVLMTTPPRLINSAWLLEHQVKDNQVLKLQPGLTVLTLHSYGSKPPGHTAGSLKNRLTEWF